MSIDESEFIILFLNVNICSIHFINIDFFDDISWSRIIVICKYIKNNVEIADSPVKKTAAGENKFSQFSYSVNKKVILLNILGLYIFRLETSLLNAIISIDNDRMKRINKTVDNIIKINLHPFIFTSPIVLVSIFSKYNINIIDDHSLKNILTYFEYRFFSIDDGSITQGDGIEKCLDLLLVAVEFGDAKARCGESNQQDVVHIQIGPLFEVGLCLVGGYKKVDAIQPCLSAFMPGNKCGRRVERKPCGRWFLFDHLQDPVPPVQDILVDKLFFDIVQGQITNGTTGIHGQSPAQQKQRQENFFHGSPLQFGPKPTGRGGIKKAP